MFNMLEVSVKHSGAGLGVPDQVWYSTKTNNRVAQPVTSEAQPITAIIQ